MALGRHRGKVTILILEGGLRGHIWCSRDGIHKNTSSYDQQQENKWSLPMNHGYPSMTYPNYDYVRYG